MFIKKNYVGLVTDDVRLIKKKIFKYFLRHTGYIYRCKKRQKENVIQCILSIKCSFIMSCEFLKEKTNRWTRDCVKEKFNILKLFLH